MPQGGRGPQPKIHHQVQHEQFTSKTHVEMWILFMGRQIMPYLSRDNSPGIILDVAILVYINSGTTSSEPKSHSARFQNGGSVSSYPGPLLIEITPLMQCSSMQR